jgi:hypothetical protein
MKRRVSGLPHLIFRATTGMIAVGCLTRVPAYAVRGSPQQDRTSTALALGVRRCYGPTFRTTRNRALPLIIRS